MRRVKQAPEFAGLLASFPALRHLLEVTEAALARSSPDVFPFHLREVERCRQLARVHATAGAWFKDLASMTATGGQAASFRMARKCLARLGTALAPVVQNRAVATLVVALEGTDAIFREVRQVLGMEGKSGEEVRAEMQGLLTRIGQDPAKAAVHHELAKRLAAYDHELYVAYDNPHVPRTNNDLESFNKAVKRPIRKCRGQKDSWFYLEHDGEGVAAYCNLLPAPHVVGGTDIASQEARSPLERAGVLPDLSVTSIMSLVQQELLVQALAKHGESYTIHRWTRKINKEGVAACLLALTTEWKSAVQGAVSQGMHIKAGVV